MLEQKIEELTRAIEALTAKLEKKPVASEHEPAPEPVPAPEPEPEPVAQDENDISFEMLKDATLKASRAGHKDAVRDKLAEMNVPKIQDLAPEQTIVFYNWVTGIVQ
jgi:cell division septum initiation protein DivIVA